MAIACRGCPTCIMVVSICIGDTGFGPQLEIPRFPSVLKLCGGGAGNSGFWFSSG